MLVVIALPAETAPSPPTPVAQQRVVYVSPDYALFSVLSTGADRVRLTQGGVSGGVLARSTSSGRARSTSSGRAQPLPQHQAPQLTWPTWSPDGRRLVASQTSQLGRIGVAALALLTPPSREPEYVQLTNRGPLTSVADGTPHYALWSPNGRRLSLIAPNREGSALELTVRDLSGSDPAFVTAGAPIYYTWSPHGLLLAVHHRDELFLRDNDGQTLSLERSYRYRAPAFNAPGNELAYIADEGTNGNLVSRDLSTGEERLLEQLTGAAAFAFSPEDPHALAAAVTPGAGFAGYDRLVLYDTLTAEERVLYDGKTYAFWWSPDGTKIALAGSDDESFTWVVVDVDSGESRALAGFFPSADFLTYIQFFDQFALSHIVWSEDSTAIVFAGELRGQPQSDALDRAWVLDVAGGTEPRALGIAVQAYFVPSGRELTRE